MCIIVAKPLGSKLPTIETFNNCAESNRDGIGFAYNLPGENPIILKGIKNVKKLFNCFKALKINENHNLLVHFRLATHGKVDQGNCHPFPLTNDYEEMRMLHCECTCAIAHNGIFSDIPRHEKFSDTAKFIGGILATPGVIENLNTNGIKELLRGYCGFNNRLAFLKPEGITLVGNYEEEDGVSYSNRQFKRWGHSNRDYFANDGLGYCYKHKLRDNCKWCGTHNEWDNCEYVAKNNTIEKATIIEIKDTKQLMFKPIATPACCWCKNLEGVKYSEYAAGYLCGDCEETIKSYEA